MELVNGDGLQYLNSFLDDSLDLIILDPDYNKWDEFIKKGIIEISIKKLKPSGNLICFTKQPFDYNLRVFINPFFRREITWTFTNGGAWCSAKMPLISTQKIYWCVKSKDFYFNPRTGVGYSEHTKNFKRTKKVFGDYEAEGRTFEKSAEGVWLRDHLHYNKPNGGKIPEKPKELIKILLKCFCPEGGKVLDPFAGSGVIPLTAEEMCLDAYACEIDSERAMKIMDAYFCTEKREDDGK